MVLTGIGVALQPIVIKFIVDQGINRPDSSTRTRFLFAALFASSYFFLGAFRMITWRVGYKRFVPALEGILFTIRSRFFRHVHGLCFRFHDQVSSGELFNYIMGSPLTSLKTFLQQFLMIVPYQSVSWVIALGALASFDWMMTLILLASVSLILIVNLRSRRTMRAMSTTFMQEESNVSKYVADMLRGTREIQIHAIEDKVSESFDHQIHRIRHQSEKLTLRRQLEHFKPETIQYIGVTLVYAAGAYSCLYRDLTVGELFAFASSMQLMLHPLMTFFQLSLTKANAEAGLERITRIMQTETSVEEKPAPLLVPFEDNDVSVLNRDIPLLDIRNLRFGYTDTPVIQGISCRVDHGQAVALVGPSGSGKTTFVRLLLRLYDPQAGSILLNGTDITSFSLKQLRSRFGVVSQDTFLFQTTLWENIRVADPTASENDIHRAMERAFVTEFLPDLPQGEHTEVGENGYALSGGQKQRVAIARAILGNHRYYIFDEATSSLDNQSEHRIQKAMAELRHGNTMIIIAHRLSTIRDVHKILVFDKGRIVQEGTYDSLATSPGLFQELLRHGL